MEKKIIKTDKAPAPIGPYSQAVWAGDLLFISGQIALNPSTNELLVTNTVEETHQVMKNIGAILEAAELDFNHIIKATIFLSDMSLFNDVNTVYGSYFTENFPARETVAVKELPKNVNVEISIIASK